MNLNYNFKTFDGAFGYSMVTVDPNNLGDLDKFMNMDYDDFLNQDWDHTSDLKMKFNMLSWNIPVNFSYRYSINDNLSIDPYIGLNFKFNILAQADIENYTCSLHIPVSQPVEALFAVCLTSRKQVLKNHHIPLYAYVQHKKCPVAAHPYPINAVERFEFLAIRNPQYGIHPYHIVDSLNHRAMNFTRQFVKSFLELLRKSNNHSLFIP